MFCQEMEGREGCPRILLPLLTRCVRLGRLPSLSGLPTPQLKSGTDDRGIHLSGLLRRCHELVRVKHLEQGVV